MLVRVVALVLIIAVLTSMAMSGEQVRALLAGEEGMRRPTAISGAVAALLDATTHYSCTLILFTDGKTSSHTVVQDVRERRRGRLDVAMFQVAETDQVTNMTYHLSLLVPLARRVRQYSSCTMVVVVSHDLAYLTAFAEWSLRGRLLVWSSRLVVVTRLALPQLRVLLPSYWTFSMMNTLFLSMKDTSRRNQFPVLSYMPYSPAGPHLAEIASWEPSRGLVFARGQKLFPEKFKSFYGSRVNVTALPYTPYWEEEEGRNNTTVYSGTDYYALATVADSLNFTIHVLPTSSWAEVTRLVEQRVSFMATILHALLPDRLHHYDYSFVYDITSLSFCMATPIFQDRWQALYYPLSVGVWTATVLTLLLTSVALVMIIRKLEVAAGSRVTKLSVGEVFQDMTGILLGQSLLHRLPSTSSIRVLMAAWLLFSLILGSTYSGNLSAFLTLPKYPPRPETLRQLVDVVDRLTMQPFGEEFRNFFANSDSPGFLKLASLMEIVPSLIEGMEQAVERSQAHLENTRSQDYTIAKLFTRPDGSKLLYIGREDIIPGGSAWPLPHDAPFTDTINFHLMAMFEAGLYQKWDRDMLFKVQLESKKRQNQQQQRMMEPPKTSPGFSIRHLQGAFIILLLGFGVSSLVFVAEFLGIFH